MTKHIDEKTLALLREFFQMETDKGFEKRFIDGLHEDFMVMINAFRDLSACRYGRDGKPGFKFTEVLPDIIEEIYAIKARALKAHGALLLASAKEAAAADAKTISDMMKGDSNGSIIITH